MIIYYPLISIILFVFFVISYFIFKETIYKNKGYFILVPTVTPFLQNNNVVVKSPKNFLKRTLFVLGIAFLCIAAGRPVTEKKAINDQKLKNILLCLDVSPSMREPDFILNNRRVTRLEALKQLSMEFLSQLNQIRAGLVVFGSSAFLQSPLTPDKESVIDSIRQLRTGVAGNGTAVGDGLALSVKRARKVPSSSTSVILITDGRSNSGMIDPLEAATAAKDLEIRVHTIGIGGRASKGPESVDEPTLTKIAHSTKGQYAYAQSSEALRAVYEEIAKLEKTEQRSLGLFDLIEHLWWFVTIGGLFIAFSLLM